VECDRYPFRSRVRVDKQGATSQVFGQATPTRNKSRRAAPQRSFYPSLTHPDTCVRAMRPCRPANHFGSFAPAHHLLGPPLYPAESFAKNLRIHAAAPSKSSHYSRTPRSAVSHGRATTTPPFTYACHPSYATSQRAWNTSSFHHTPPTSVPYFPNRSHNRAPQCKSPFLHSVL
jgi:hypothetical protein